MGRIFVIEDDDQVRMLYRDILVKAGHEVIEARDGREGMRLFRQAPGDLVITDIIMPKKDGVETIRELKRDFPGVKIIAITGARGIFNRLPAAENLGADIVMRKPTTVQEIVVIVTGLLSG